MAQSKQPQAKSSLTSHGIIILATGTVILLAWRTTGGNKILTPIIGLIVLLLVFKNYSTIESQIKGV